MTNLYIGIDPGMSGAVGVLDASGGFKEVIDMPTQDIHGKGRIDAHRLFNELEGIIWGWASGPDDIRLAIEKVHALPEQSAQSGFSFGDTVGRTCACLDILEIKDIHYVRPQAWKKYFKLDRDKAKTTAFAAKVFSNAPLYGPKGGAKDGRAEALLIARWLYEQQ